MAIFRGYIRVSTIEQGVSYSPTTQREKLERAAKQEKLNYKHYEDHSTGKTFDRKDFNRLMADLQPGDIIGVRDAKRLGRNLKEGVEFIDDLMHSKKVSKLYVKNRVYNLAHYKDRHDLQQDLNDAEYDFEERRELSAEGIRKKQELGEWKFSSRLTGYDHQKDGTITQNEAQAELIREMAALYVGGTSFLKISSLLNERKIHTKRGNPWRPSTVRRLLLNPIFAGYYIPRKWTGNIKTLSLEKIKLEELIKLKFYVPIISLEEYKKILASYRGVRRTHARQFGYRYRSFLLTGLIRCKDCEKLGKNVRYVHSYQKSRAKTHKVNENYTSRIHAKGCKNQHKTLRLAVFNNLVECLFYLVFIDPYQLIAFVETELDGIREQLVSSLAARESNLEEMTKLKKKFEHFNKRLGDLRSKLETEEDEDRISALEQAQEETLVQRASVRRKMKEIESPTGGVLTFLDSNEEEHEVDITSLNDSEKENLISSALDDAAEELSRKFSEDKLLEFFQHKQDGDRRLILIDFLKEIGVSRDRLIASFKNGKRFETRLIPNKGRQIQREFIVKSFFNDQEDGSFRIDCSKKTIEWNHYPLEEDHFKNIWQEAQKGNLNALLNRINEYKKQFQTAKSVS